MYPSLDASIVKGLSPPQALSVLIAKLFTSIDRMNDYFGKKIKQLEKTILLPQFLRVPA